MNEENVLFSIEKHPDGVAVEVHCKNGEELFNVAQSIASVAAADEMFAFVLLRAIKIAFSEEGQEYFEKNSVQMPDFNKLLNSNNNTSN